MANTIYAAFSDAALAEKAAGALLDHGVRPEDISLVRSHNGEITGMDANTTTNAYGNVSDGDNDAKNAADAAWGGTQSAGNRTAEYGDRIAGGVADAIGADNAAAGYRAAANERDMRADQRAREAGAEMNDAVDLDKTTGYGTTYDRTDRINDPDYQSNMRDDDADKEEQAAKKGISTTTGADAGAGALKGAGIGLGLGVLAGLASLFVPGIGLVVGGGALAAALGGAAAATGAGAVAGAVTGYLKDQGVDAHVAADYDQEIQHGGALLSVTVPSGNVDEMKVREVIGKYGASNINAYASKGYVA